MTIQEVSRALIPPSTTKRGLTVNRALRRLGGSSSDRSQQRTPAREARPRSLSGTWSCFSAKFFLFFLRCKITFMAQNLTHAPQQSRVLCDRPIGAGRQRRAVGKGVWLVEATPDRRHSLATNICWSIFESGQCFGNWPVPAHSGLRRLLPVAARPARTCSLGHNPPPSQEAFEAKCALGPIQDLAHGGGKLIGRQRLLNHFHVGVETPLMNNRVARISGHVKHF
jgi:hypothetical protein